MIHVRVFRDGVADEGEIEPSAIADCVAQKDAFVWFDASEPTDEDIAALGQAFHLHPLTLEDIGHRRQRPRVELFEDYGFITMRPLSLHGDDLTEHEVHAVVGKRFLGTLRYGPDPFPIDEVVKRWQRQPELLASDPGGFAVYVLFDEVVDGYLNIVEQLEDTADDLEDLVFADDPSVDRPQVQERIFVVKREVVRLRRFSSPMRQGLDLLQEQPGLVGDALLPYFRDVTEHAIRVSELADNIRDLLTSLLELRVAQVANHLNVIMRKLTAWAGILLVPTLIAGIYGMNFRNMPELGLALRVRVRADRDGRLGVRALHHVQEEGMALGDVPGRDGPVRGAGPRAAGRAETGGGRRGVGAHRRARPTCAPRSISSTRSVRTPWWSLGPFEELVAMVAERFPGMRIVADHPMPGSRGRRRDGSDAREALRARPPGRSGG